MSGSVRLVIDVSTGEVAQRLDYDAYGRVTADTHPGFQPFGYNGGLYDVETGLVRFGARDYDAQAGRWTTPDPTLFEGGSTNLYAYAGSDPVNYLDFTGKESLTELAVSMALDETIDVLEYGIPNNSAAGKIGTGMLDAAIELAKFANSPEVKAAQASIGSVNKLLNIWGGDVNTPKIEDAIADAQQYNQLLVASVARKAVWLALGQKTKIFDSVAEGAGAVLKCVLGAAFDTQMSFEVIREGDNTESIVDACITDPLVGALKALLK
jgi:RHS repeat-associated protein